MTKVRFAPSPTGKLHLGSARTAVFNWLYARHTGGKLVLRIEDTDLSRSQEIYTESIIKDMKWMGMDYDEFYKQSDRFEIYRSYVDKLLEMGKAYYCTCSREDLLARNSAKGLMDQAAKYDGNCRGKKEKPAGDFVVRLDIGGDRDIAFKDVVKARINVNTKELDDYVILKSDGSPTYNFAVVVDDALMEMTHIIRGEDHITNTTKQIILYENLGFTIPQFAHLPLVMGKDKAPLSKRKGSTNIEYYRAQGILPSALLNAIARLGWSHGNDEVFTMEELMRYFDIEKLSKSNAVYDEEKMMWLNGKHMRALPLEKFIQDFEEFLKETNLPKQGKMLENQWFLMALDGLRGRHSNLKSLYEETLSFAQNVFSMDEKALPVLEELKKNVDIEKAYVEVKKWLLAMKNWENRAEIEENLKSTAAQHSVKLGDLIQRLRIQLTGKTISPDIILLFRLLGEETVKRMERP
jgi:glutamyl-tRNA synthetase